MNSLEKQVESKLQLWPLVGPALVILSVMLLSIRSDIYTHYLPYFGLFSLPLCWKGKIRGFAISLGILVAMLCYQWTSIPVDERLWEGGMSVALALSLLVTALSFDEVVAPVKAFQAHAEGVTHENETLKTSLGEKQQELTRSKEKLLQILEEAEQEIVLQRKLYKQVQEEAKKHLDAVQSYTKLVAMAREEVITLNKENENVKRALVDARQALLLAQEQAEEKQQNYEHKLTVQKNRVEQLEEDLKRAQEQAVEQKSRLETVEQDLKQAQEEAKKSQDILQEESEDPRRYVGLYKQLRQQFEEKTATLNATRQELFHTQEQFEKQKRESEEALRSGLSESEKRLEKHILTMEKEFGEKERAYEQEIESLQDIITSLSLGQAEAKN